MTDVRSSGRPQRVLFLCIHNSARSQMAEGLLRHLGGAAFEPASAGTVATAVRPLAIAALAEVGIDISQQTSKTLDQFRRQPIDTVITLCDEAAEACPVFPAAKRTLHWPFPDPSQASGGPEAQLAVYREVRDAVRARIVRDLINPQTSSEGGSDD